MKSGYDIFSKVGMTFQNEKMYFLKLYNFGHEKVGMTFLKSGYDISEARIQHCRWRIALWECPKPRLLVLKAQKPSEAMPKTRSGCLETIRSPFRNCETPLPEGGVAETASLV